MFSGVPTVLVYVDRIWETQPIYKDLLKELKDAGKTVVVISHDIKEVLNIVDRVVVLRQGAVAGEGYSKDLDQGNVVDWITGVER